MTDLNFKTVDDIKAYVEESELEFATIGFVDLQGAVRAKYVSRDKLLSALNAISFPIITLALDSADEILEAPKIAEDNGAFSDAPLKLDPTSARIVPWENSNRNLLLLGEFIEEGGQFCPRALYNRTFNTFKEKGFTFVHGVELEFTLFNETSKSAAEKGYTNLETATLQKSYYSYQRQLGQTEFYNDLMDLCKTLKIDLDSLHEEMGGGFMEVALSYGSGIKIPDNSALFKTFCKALAAKHGQLASFMARWSNNADGHSGHVHLSIIDNAGKNIFFDPNKDNCMSDEMMFFIGGLQKLLPEFVLMMAPNINSFKRLVPGIFAPISAEWGIENRTCSLRAIPGSKNSSRVECRTPGADANAYLSLSAMMAAGIYGIDNKIEPTAPSTTNVYNTPTPDHLKLPASFKDAIERFNQSTAARTYFGDDFVEAYAGSRRSQYQQFQALVSNNELERFFDLV